ncbi:MAG: HAD hydrolase-like protein [Pseudomonadota bacterium]
MSFDFSGWTLVFDLDGTLVETAPDLHAALNHTLAHKGLAPVTLDTIRMMIGDGAKAMIRKGLTFHQAPIDQAEIDETLWPIFLDYYSAHITRLSTPFHNSMSCLSALQQNSATLAVCTNKAQGLAEQVLSGLQMDRQFKAIVGGDALPVKKPDAHHLLETIARSGGSPARAIMVGDSQTDEKAARNAGLPFVFVSFGYGTLSGQPYERLRSIDHWRDMQQALSQLAAGRP